MSNFGPRHYVPVLKGKKGEFDALDWLSDANKDALTPLIEVFTVPWDWNEDTPAKSLEDHAESTIARIAAGWGSGRELFLDTVWLDPDEEAGGKHHLEYLFDLARSAQLEAVPVGGLARGTAHTAAVAAVAATEGRGACLRLDSDDVADPQVLGPLIDQWLRDVALGAADADLVVDFAEVTSGNLGAFNLAASILLPSLPYLDDWRSLTLTSGAFPRDLSAVAPDSEDRLERYDWRLWLGIDSTLISRKPTFGDYAISHPGLSDPDPRTIRPSASIRYAAPDHWLIVKRRWAIRYGFAQFRDASAIVKTQGEYAGSAHCRGDSFIDACAAGGPTGNLTTWRSVGTCHHLATTVETLANLP